MTNQDDTEIERKWKLDSRHMVKLYQRTRTWTVRYITQWYLAEGALKHNLEHLRMYPDYAILLVHQKDGPWVTTLPYWAHEVAVGHQPGTVRLRHCSHDSRGAVNQYFLTIKGKGGIERPEFEMELPEKIFSYLLQLERQGNAVVKRRFSFTPIDGHTLELDIFEGHHTGLVLMEVEFPDRETADKYNLVTTWGYFNPLEVTDDPNYGNYSLAVNGLPSD